MKTNLKNLDNSQVQIEFELSQEEFSKYIDKALAHLKKHIKVDGFRPGNVPDEIAKKQINDETLLMEAGDLAVNESYKKFVNENNIEPIGNTQVQVVKIAKDNPFLFNVTVSVIPAVKLPDYKSIASAIKGKEISVDEREVEEAIHYLQKSRAKISQKDKPAEMKDFVYIEYQNESINNGKEIKDQFILGEGGFMKDFEENLIGMKAEDEKEFTAKFPENHPDKKLSGKEAKFKVKMLAVNKVDLPEVNDEFAKNMGAFDSLVSLKEDVKEGVLLEKQGEEKQRKRGEVLGKISEKTEIDIPLLLVENEQKRLMENFKNQVATNFKMDFEVYLSSIKKSEEEIQKSFKLEAEKRIKDFLVLREIGRQERVEVSLPEIEEEMNKIIKNYSKDEINKIDINQIKEYTKDTIFNEKVFNLLDQLSNKNSTAR
ncbi:MAG: trigger factor [Candidatus Staskawiczbacteria bacterium RIFCSPHIGHO2_02_FULL_34_9]|uniref:Trigger factor n=1 Tax=Candidatus Staskawiczbacteria bacterium RIFCSPHIGHO2_02_FULL_34_9 TaxID=1802206 RepID=A0A1G2I221_9BACT|nr:MAG: trigger factor [Candidatus Staskawiczbacteria bacterium RIFCSPHIGHO2_02_FULL_34_9]